MESQKKGHRYLKTISTPQQIHNHPTNTSQSKCLYTFPKASRFSVYSKDKQIRADYYDIDLKYLKNQRACSLGKGNKSDFTKNMGESPGPCQYSSLVNTIKQKVDKNKGISFGLSREKCKIVGQRDTKFDKVFPGPGTYKIKSNFDPTNLKHVSFRIKTKSLKEDNNVGPGKYDIRPLIGEASSKWTSTYKGNGATKINPLPKVLRALDQNKDTSQMVYDQTFQINKDGKYFNSKYQNTKLGFMGKAKRDEIQTGNNIPGPGTYQSPSDFGIYKSSIATQLLYHLSLFSEYKESVSTYPSLIFAQESVFLWIIPSSFYTFKYPLCLETLVSLSVQFSLVKYPILTLITISFFFIQAIQDYTLIEDLLFTFQSSAEAPAVKQFSINLKQSFPIRSLYILVTPRAVFFSCNKYFYDLQSVISHQPCKLTLELSSSSLTFASIKYQSIASTYTKAAVIPFQKLSINSDKLNDYIFNESILCLFVVVPFAPDTTILSKCFVIFQPYA